MAALPSVGYRKVVKAFEVFGWTIARQGKGHVIMTKEGQIATLSVPAQSRCQGHASKLDTPRRVDS
jgi:predicted RNA binding protein YcfA (HicA-like mRNA interferase family)